MNEKINDHISNVITKIERNEKIANEVFGNMQKIARNMVASNVMMIIAIEKTFGRGE